MFNKKTVRATWLIISYGIMLCILWITSLFYNLFYVLSILYFFEIVWKVEITFCLLLFCSELPSVCFLKLFVCFRSCFSFGTVTQTSEHLHKSSVSQCLQKELNFYHMTYINKAIFLTPNILTIRNQNSNYVYIF